MANGHGRYRSTPRRLKRKQQAVAMSDVAVSGNKPKIVNTIVLTIGVLTRLQGFRNGC